MFKRILTTVFLAIIPFVMFAGFGIPEESKSLVYNVTIVGVIIVLFALTIVSFSVGLMSKIIHYTEVKRNNGKEKGAKKKAPEYQEEIIVAIAAAIHLELRSYNEEEKAILTIRKIIKPFSGWNNKAYGMRNYRI